VWAFRLDGVVHEHQTVTGVSEDVHQIIQNLKALVLRLDADHDQARLELRAGKAGAVTAGMVEKTGGVEVLDPEHHLFTLQEDREVHMELHVKKGRGFVAADDHELPKGSPVDLVRIDAIFNPVLRANFTVEETRVGQRTDFDRLTLQIETNGSVAPEAAVAYAAELTRKQLEYLLRFGTDGESEPPVPGAVPVSKNLRELLERPIEDLAELSVRSVNSLKKEEIITLGHLVRRTEDQMLDIDNFGVKSLEEIRQFLAEHDLHFGMQLEESEGGELYLVEESGDSGEPVVAEGEAK
jgi:DNA-directed RNA polymerase subunit alpha